MDRGRVFGPFFLLLVPLVAGTTEWPFWGGNLNNTREATAAFTNVSTVGDVRVLFNITVAGSQSAPPTVYGDGIYFPTWAGSFYAASRLTGSLLWRQSVIGWTTDPLCSPTSTQLLESGRSFTAMYSRSSPAVAGAEDDLLILGTIPTDFNNTLGAPYVLGKRLHGCKACRGLANPLHFMLI